MRSESRSVCERGFGASLCFRQIVHNLIRLTCLIQGKPLSIRYEKLIYVDNSVLIFLPKETRHGRNHSFRPSGQRYRRGHS